MHSMRSFHITLYIGFFGRGLLISGLALYEENFLLSPCFFREGAHYL